MWICIFSRNHDWVFEFSEMDVGFETLFFFFFFFGLRERDLLYSFQILQWSELSIHVDLRISRYWTCNFPFPRDFVSKMGWGGNGLVNGMFPSLAWIFFPSFHPLWIQTLVYEIENNCVINVRNDFLKLKIIYNFPVEMRISPSNREFNISFYAQNSKTRVTRSAK